MKKIRHIIAERLFAPKRCCDGQNERALAFKHAIISSSLTERLNADVAAKAAQPLGTPISQSGSKKQTYQDTDNKKREFGGEVPPGLEGSGGFIYDPNSTGEDPDAVLRLSPSITSQRMNEMEQRPNFGWVKKDKTAVAKPLNQKPQIVIKKYKVNPKTDDIIPSSEKIINPFSTFSGDEFSDDSIPEPKNTKKIESQIKTKMLPGRSLSSRIPGGSLLGRAAAAIGIIRDANNKFRCPPGTPAANQFTDMYGTTCFNVSPSRMANFIQDKAIEVTDAGQMQGFTRFARRASRWLQTGSWDDNQGISDLPVNRVAKYLVPGSRAPGFDPTTGRSVAPDWASTDVPPDMRVFKNTMANAQRRSKQAKETVDRLARSLGVDTSETAKATNADLDQVFQELNNRGMWDIQLSRMNPDEVESLVRERIQAIEASRDIPLTPEQRERLVKADIQRYYVTERAMLEAHLEQFTKMPEHMRTHAVLNIKRWMPGEIKDEASSAMLPPQDGQRLRQTIDVNMDVIMTNQERKLPGLNTNERLLITAVGGSSDAERMREVADFMSMADIHANHMAGLANGVEGMARHIMLHEIGHSVQNESFVNAIAREIDSAGFIEINGKKYDDIRKIPTKLIAELRVRANPALQSEESLNKLRKLSNVYGAYPEESFSAGNTAVGALEAQTELWALREGGFIQGDDIDAALGYMDDYVDARRTAERERVSEEFLRSLERGEYRPRPSAGMVDASGATDTPTEKAPSSIGELSVENRRKALNSLSMELRENDLEEDDFIEIASTAKIESEIVSDQISDLTKNLNALKKKRQDIIDKSPEKEGDDDDLALIKDIEVEQKKLNTAQNAKEFHDEAYRRVRKEWKKKFGIGTKEESTKFDEMVYDSRKANGRLSDSEKLEIAKEERQKFIASEAKKMEMDDLVNEISAMEAKYADGKFDSPEELIEMDEKHETFVNEYIDRQIEKGDTRTRKQIKKELINRIEEKLFPKPKPNKKFKSTKEAKDHALRERKKLRKRITKEQAEAVREISDFDSKDIVQILKPENNASAGRAMNRSKARLQRLGLENDPKSTSEGSMEEQVENILVPVMEAMEVSSVSEPFEIEALIDVDPGQMTGRSVGKDFDHSSFISGKVIGKGHKKAEVSKRADPRTGKKQRRVVVSLKEGDRGLFPTAKGDEKQAFVIPPGKLKIVGRDPDGTIRVEVSSQKGTTEVLDDLARDMSDGAGDTIWRRSAARKIKAISDKRVISSPERLSSGRSVDSTENKRTSRNIVNSVIDSGGSFGRYDLPGSRDRSAYKPEANQARKIVDIDDFLEQLKNPVGDNKNPFDLEIDDEQLKELLDKMPRDVLRRRVENEAIKFHTGLDKRPRVRMRESQLDEFAETGKIRASRSGAPSVSSGQSRRAQRLSSGAQPMGRKEREQEFAKRVRERIEKNLSEIPPPELDPSMSSKQRSEAVRKHVDNWFDSLSDAQLESMGIKRAYDSDNNPITSKTTGRTIYQTENNEVAAALLSLGQTAEMPAHVRGESAMVKQAANQIKKELKKLAKENKDIIVTADLCKFYVEGKNVFCKKNLKVDRLEMPQVGGRAVDNKSMALRIWGSGLATAETAQAHISGEEGRLTKALKSKVDELRSNGNENAAKELESEIKTLEFIGLGFEGAGVEQKDITPEQKAVMDKHGVKITGRELKRLGEKWNRAATARMEGREPDKSDAFTPEEEKLFFEHVDYSMLEPDGVDAFTDFLKMLGVGVEEDRITKPDELMASQRELDGPKVDGISENILAAVKRIRDMSDPADRKKEVERLRRENGLFKKILISKEGYIVDGHHRIIGKVVTNGVISEDMPEIGADDLDMLGLPVRQIDMGIIELLTVSRVYQDFLGIKAASLAQGAEESFKEDMHGIEKIPKITKEQFDTAQAQLLYELEEKTDAIYEAGTFIQVDSVGLNDTEQSLIYKASELRRQEQATARQETRRKNREVEKSQRLSSGAISKIDRAVKNTNIDDQSREKIVFALRNIAEYKKGSTRQELNDFAEKIKYVSGDEIAKLAINQMQEFGLINEYEKNNIEISMDLAENDSAQMSSFIKNAFIDGSEALSNIWSPEKEESGGRKTGSAYSSRKFGIDNFDLENESAESSIDRMRRDFWNANGLNNDIDDETLPVSGYMVHGSHMDKKKRNALNSGALGIDDDAVFEIGDKDVVGDGLTAQGEIEVVLKPEVAGRTAYGKGGALKSGHRPVLVNSSSRNDIVQALTTNKNGIDQDAVMNMLVSSIDGRTDSINAKRPKGKGLRKTGQDAPAEFDNEAIQAHILGGFDKEDVESINYPYSKIQKISENENIDDVINERSMADILRKSGFTEAEINYFYSMSNGKPLTTQSIQALKSFRASQKIKDKYKKQGFENVKFAHPLGFNIENPKTYNINAQSGQSVEEVLRNNISKEIVEEAKKAIKEMRKNTSPFFNASNSSTKKKEDA